MTKEQYKQLRERLKLSQQALADTLDVSRETINRRESGQCSISVEAALAVRMLVRDDIFGATQSKGKL